MPRTPARATPTNDAADADRSARDTPTPDVVRALERKAVELTRLAFEMTAEAGSGHPTSAASLAHVVTVLMYHELRLDPARPDHPLSDRLVLSEGHACPIVYAACADLGVALEEDGERRPMTRADALRLRALDSPVDGHPNPPVGFPFFPAATGSLGQGLSLAAGLALAARLDGRDVRVPCLIGDGESREGQVWEALDFLVDHDLRAVCPVFNANGHGQTGAVSPQQRPEALAAKLRAFGFEPLVIDGHDVEAVAAAFASHRAALASGDAPVAVVARTVKGWGTPSWADHASGHHGKPADGDDLQRALSELDEQLAALGDGTDLATVGPRPLPDQPVAPAPAPSTDAAWPTLSALLRADGEHALARGEGELATRKAYGLALRELGLRRPDVVALDGDVSNSTYAKTFAAADANAARFFEARIAEQNMVSVAAGLAAGGKLPFVSSFGKFLTRAYDQIEMALIGGQPLRLVGSHVGVSLAADGPSQMALPDAAWFAAWTRVQRGGRPVLHVLTPSDATSCYALTRAMAEGDGAAYLRTLRPGVPLLYSDEDEFELGGHKLVRPGAHVLLAAWGYMVHEALRAADALAERGVQAAVVDLYSLPFDEDALVALARESGDRVVALEDDYGGAIGTALAEAFSRLGDRAPELRVLSVHSIPKSGRTPEGVLEALGLATEDVVAAAAELVGAR